MQVFMLFQLCYVWLDQNSECGILPTCWFLFRFPFLCRFQIVSSRLGFSFPHRLATVFICLTFLAVSFQDFGKGLSSCRSNFSVPSISLLLGLRIVEILAKCWRGLQSRKSSKIQLSQPHSCLKAVQSSFWLAVVVLVFCLSMEVFIISRGHQRYHARRVDSMTFTARMLDAYLPPSLVLVGW